MSHEVYIKQERPGGHDVERDLCLRHSVKEEVDLDPDTEPTYVKIEPAIIKQEKLSEDELKLSLHLECAVKQEVDIGPVMLHPPDAVYAITKVKAEPESTTSDMYISQESKKQLNALDKQTTSPLCDEVPCKDLNCEKSVKQTFKSIQFVPDPETDDKPFKCTVCGCRFPTRRGLTKHSLNHEKPFKCSACGKRFSFRYNLSKHACCHAGNILFRCSKCEKRFTSRSTLKVHKLSHKGEKPFKCSECGRCFTHLSNLKIHSECHTGFKCSECGKCFAFRKNLTIHMRFHTGEKPFKCSVCSKCFSYLSGLHSHARTHMDETRFNCSQCGKCFSNRRCLKSHDCSHKDEIPSSECDRSFVSLDSLLVQAHEHVDVTPVWCNCSEVFKCLTHRYSLADQAHNEKPLKTYSSRQKKSII